MNSEAAFTPQSGPKPPIEPNDELALKLKSAGCRPSKAV